MAWSIILQKNVTSAGTEEMLFYHPFFDSRHCAFRIIRLFVALGDKTIEVDRLRLMDFYLLFPDALAEVTLPRAAANSLRKYLRTEIPPRYEKLPDLRVMFARMESVQLSSISNLIAHGILDAECFRDGKIRRTGIALPDTLIELANTRNKSELGLIQFLTVNFIDLPLYGKNSVRQRTDLFDWRYDLT